MVHDDTCLYPGSLSRQSPDKQNSNRFIDLCKWLRLSVTPCAHQRQRLLPTAVQILNSGVVARQEIASMAGSQLGRIGRHSNDNSRDGTPIAITNRDNKKLYQTSSVRPNPRLTSEGYFFAGE
jgi:hypothetical protein